MSGFKETEIGLIPDDWEIIPISALGKCITGTTPKTSIQEYYEPPEYDFIAPADIGNHKYVLSSERKISKKGLDVIRTLPKNSILCVCIGSTIGKTGMSFKEVSGTNQQINSIVCNNNFEPEFIYYVLNYYSDYWKGFATPSPVPLLSKGRFEQIIVSITRNKTEQKNILLILSKIQESIVLQTQILQNLQELKKALMQKLFIEGLNSESLKDTEIGKIPVSWEVSEIKKYINKTYQRNTNLLPDKEILYIDVSSISNITFTIAYATKYLGKDAPGRARKVVSEGDIIFATVRPTLKRIAIVNNEYEDEYCSTAFCVLRTDNDMLNNEYLYYYLQTDYFISEMGKLQAGASYPAVRDIDVKNMKIPVPKLDEQINIANVFKGIDEKIKFVSQRQKSLNSLFNTLLNQLMTGIIRVKDLEV